MNKAPGDEPQPSAVSRKLLAEFVGTFFLTFVGAGIEIVAVLKPGHIDRSVKAVAPALVVATMIYAVGDVSGAHLNPVVTLVFWLRRDFPSRNVPFYWLTQVVASVAAATALRALFGTVRDVGINRLEDVTTGKGFVIEVILSFLLVFVILNTANQHSLIGTQAAIAVGAAITICGLIGGELTTASMNPARSLGPAIVDANAKNLWVFVAGPAMGALTALAIMVALRPHRSDGEHEAAQGHQHD